MSKEGLADRVRISQWDVLLKGVLHSTFTWRLRIETLAVY